MYDGYGFATSYKIMGVIVLFFLLTSAFILSNDRDDDLLPQIAK
jgi:hypothetical protein